MKIIQTPAWVPLMHQTLTRAMRPPLAKHWVCHRLSKVLRLPPTSGHIMKAARPPDASPDNLLLQQRKVWILFFLIHMQLPNDEMLFPGFKAFQCNSVAFLCNSNPFESGQKANKLSPQNLRSLQHASGRAATRKEAIAHSHPLSAVTICLWCLIVFTHQWNCFE